MDFHPTGIFLFGLQAVSFPHCFLIKGLRDLWSLWRESSELLGFGFDFDSMGDNLENGYTETRGDELDCSSPS